MFKELIAKECFNQTCPLAGQMQDKGLPICPECASELKPIERSNQRLLAILAIGGLLLSGSLGSVGYGMVVKNLAAGDTMKWLLGRVQLTPNLSRSVPDPILEGWLKLKSTRPDARFFDDNLLCENRDGVSWCRERAQIAGGDEAWFDLIPHVDHLYVFYRGPGRSVTLFPVAGVTAGVNKSIELPNKQRMRISGPAGTETFVIVASKQPVASLAALAARSDVTPAELDQAVKPVATAPDTFAVYVEIPHS